MSRYRKRPIVIEAVRFVPGKPVGEMLAHLEGCPGWHMDGPSLIIPTLEGEMSADPGDYIIKGVQGEYYPCKPDIFAASYEAADAPEAKA